MASTLNSFASLTCFCQALPNVITLPFFPPISVHYITHFYPISNDSSTLPLAFPPCHSGEWIIHVRAACWWRWIMWEEQDTRARLRATLLSKDPRTALGGVTVILHSLLYRPLPSQLSGQSHVSSTPSLPSKPRHPQRPFSSFSPNIRVWYLPVYFTN